MSAPASAKSHTKGEQGERTACSEGSEEVRKREREWQRKEKERKREKEGESAKGQKRGK